MAARATSGIRRRMENTHIYIKYIFGKGELLCKFSGTVYVKVPIAIQYAHFVCVCACVFSVKSHLIYRIMSVCLCVVLCASACFNVCILSVDRA